jgi:xanthine dehydrogenase accessory factor
VEIHIQPVLPVPRVVVYGVSPVARALARLAGAMGYALCVADPTADEAAFPGAETVTDPASVRRGETSAPLFAVVATQGQWDEDALAAALALEPDYLGVVASAKRFGEMRALLPGRVPEAALARVKNPAGLDLGARGPEEIAVSILAEIVQERRHAALPVPAPGRAPAFAEALDPVCGMTVRVADARHRAQHAGRDFYFCAAVCRERFLAEPERYLAVAGAP